MESAYSSHLIDHKSASKTADATLGTTASAQANHIHGLPEGPAGSAINFRRVALPYCDRCQTDEFTHLESFKPALSHSNGTLRTLGQITYFCSGCEFQLGHSVPPMWAPAGWYLG